MFDKPGLPPDKFIATLDRWTQHPDTLVRIEASWASAKAGDTKGREQLAFYALNPNWSQRAIAYLRELGLERYIPQKASDPDFVALAEMSSWLAHPNEMGRPPDRIAQFDSRRLNWPPTNDARTLWLFRYAYDGDDGQEGYGLVGSTTFALFGEATTDLAAEDVYGLHCAWELEMLGDERAPAKRTPGAGRKLIAAANRDFPT